MQNHKPQNQTTTEPSVTFSQLLDNQTRPNSVCNLIAPRQPNSTKFTMQPYYNPTKWKTTENKTKMEDNQNKSKWKTTLKKIDKQKFQYGRQPRHSKWKKTKKKSKRKKTKKIEMEDDQKIWRSATIFASSLPSSISQSVGGL